MSDPGYLVGSSKVFHNNPMINPCVNDPNFGNVLSDTKLAVERETGLSMARRRLQRGSLYKTKSGGFLVWRVKYMKRFQVPDQAEVKIVRKDDLVGTMAQFPTKKLAQRAVDQMLAEYNDTNYQPSYLVSFGSMIDKWEKMVLPQHKLLTQKGEETQLRILRASFGSTLLHEMKRETIQKWISQQTKYSPKTVRNLLGTLRLVWQSAQDWNYVPEDARSPFERLSLPKKALVEVPCFTVEQVREIIQKADEPYKTMFWILAETGMRGGEVCGLFYNDIDIKNHVIRVKRSIALGILQTPKTGKAVRTFPISPVLAEHLDWFMQNPLPCGDPKGHPRKTATERHPLLFVNHHGQSINSYNVARYTLKPILESIGITDNDGFGLHAFRHANATAMQDTDAPMKVRQERLGHASAVMTMNYTHAQSKDHRATAAKLGEMFRPLLPANTENEQVQAAGAD